MVIRIFFFILIIFSASNDCIQRGSRLIELKTEIGTIPWNSVIDRDAAFGEGTIQCTGVNRDQDTSKKKKVPRQVNGPGVGPSMLGFASDSPSFNIKLNLLKKVK